MSRTSSLARVTTAVLTLVVASALIVAVAVEANGGPTARNGSTSSGATNPIDATGGTITPPPASHLKSLANLPPSHDNDAGHSRIIDTTPDADYDWYQRHP